MYLEIYVNLYTVLIPNKNKQKQIGIKIYKHTRNTHTLWTPKHINLDTNTSPRSAVDYHLGKDPSMDMDDPLANLEDKHHHIL